MDKRKTLDKIMAVANTGNLDALRDAYSLIKSIESDDEVVVSTMNGYGADQHIKNSENFEYAHKMIKEVRSICGREIKEKRASEGHVHLYRDTLLFDAPYSFDEAILYAEWNRPYSKKFYAPRRKQLLPVVQAMQRLEERKTRLLLLMMPPGVGKSTIELMFQRWSGGRNPDLSILMGSHSNSLLQGCYGELLRMCEKDGEYLWNDIFPEAPLVNTDAKNLRIDLEKSKRFSTFEFSSVGSGNAGKVRASNLLCVDDIVDGIETAMSRDRLDKLWQQFHTDYMQRMQGDCAILVVATPWSLYDPIDRLADMHRDDPECEIIRCPALDENDHSNFDYPMKLGFSDEFYHNQRNIMDDASWNALYMMKPIEREGTLYPDDELRKYFELPEGDPDAIYAVCDTKTTGSDYCVLPIAYQFGEDFYIEDMVCSNLAPDIVENMVVEKLCKHNPQMARFESNVAGGKMAQDVQKRIKAKGCKTSISTKWTQANKETKIQVESPWIKQHCIFKDDSVLKGSEYKEYRLFMNQLTTYTMAGKNAHDDVPDAMAQLSQFIQGFSLARVEVKRRMF